MGFFEQQHRARRRTWLTLLLFVLAVIAIVAAFDLVCAIVYIWLFDAQILYSNGLLRQVPRSVYLWSTLATLLVIGWGTASRLYRLRRRRRGRRPDRRAPCETRQRRAGGAPL